MSVIQWSGMTHPGRFRLNNEDAFLGLILLEQEAHHLGKEGSHSLENCQFVFAVSDGMGGANAGEYASKLAMQTVLKYLPPALLDAYSYDPALRQDVIKNLFLKIHDSLRSMGKYYDEIRGMGATLSLVWIHGYVMTFGHIGDSRIYHLPPDEGILQISEDHSEVGRLFRAGKINEREAKTHPNRHILEQTLGGESPGVAPQTGEVQLLPGSQIVLCSDGIYDGLFTQSIGHVVRNPPATIANLRPSERLIKEALFGSGKDNLTALVLAVE
jgi:PPM family protein phosphatase